MIVNHHDFFHDDLTWLDHFAELAPLLKPNKKIKKLDLLGGQPSLNPHRTGQSEERFQRCKSVIFVLSALRQSTLSIDIFESFEIQQMI